MISLLVTIQIKDGFREQFIEALLGDSQGSVRDEPGCFRFDILQDNEDSNRLHLFEVYADAAALDAHRETPHYKKWRATVDDWFEVDMQRLGMTTIFPSDDGWKAQKPHLLNW